MRSGFRRVCRETFWSELQQGERRQRRKSLERGMSTNTTTSASKDFERGRDSFPEEARDESMKNL